MSRNRTSQSEERTERNDRIKEPFRFHRRGKFALINENSPSRLVSRCGQLGDLILDLGDDLSADFPLPLELDHIIVPPILMNLAFDFDAKTSISVDFPIRRRPRHVTNDAFLFIQSAIKSRISPSLPKKSIFNSLSFFEYYSI